MGFKITLVLLVVACLVLDVNAWRRRRRRGSSRRRWGRKLVRGVKRITKKAVRFANKVRKWKTAIQYGGMAGSLLGDSKDGIKSLREKSEQEYQDMVNKITSAVREDEGEEAAQFTAQLLDQISSKNPEEVSEEMKKKMEAFLDEDEQAFRDADEQAMDADEQAFLDADEQAMDADGEEEIEGFDIE